MRRAGRTRWVVIAGAAAGLAVLARIRSRHPELPVVILSGHADEELTREALALGALDVIKKPAVLAHLSDTLTRLKRP